MCNAGFYKSIKYKFVCILDIVRFRSITQCINQRSLIKTANKHGNTCKSTRGHLLCLTKNMRRASIISRERERERERECVCLRARAHVCVCLRKTERARKEDIREVINNK